MCTGEQLARPAAMPSSAPSSSVRTRAFAWSLAALALALPRLAAAAPTEVNPGDDLGAAINALAPGDELILHGGTYEQTARLGLTIVGTEAMPITIRAADGEVPIIHRGDDSQNLVDFDHAEYVIIRGIEFVGGSAGLRFSNSRFVTLEDNDIHDTGDVAIRANDGGSMYEGFQILHNEVHHTNGTGEGMYLGCNENACQFFGATIAFNHVHHTNQDTVEQGDGIEIKEGSHDNVVRDNVIHDTNYPCLITYSAVGNGGPNILERNVLWNCGDHGIQSAADSVIRNNIILGSVSDGIAMQQHQSGSPSNIVIAHNTVLHPANDAISLRAASGSVIIANNALYAQQGRAIYVNGGDTSMVQMIGNVGEGGIEGFDATLGAGSLAADFLGGNYSGAPPIDLFPAPDGALVGAGDPSQAVDDDFNCNARGDAAPDVGAYLFDPDGNPGWTIAEGFKDCAGDGGGATTGADGGGSDGGADGTGGGASDGGSASAGDAGTGGGASAGEGGSGLLDGGGGSDAGASDDGSDGGCGCRQSSSTPAWWLVAVVTLLRRRGRGDGRRRGDP